MTMMINAPFPGRKILERASALAGLLSLLLVIVALTHKGTGLRYCACVACASVFGFCAMALPVRSGPVEMASKVGEAAREVCLARVCGGVPGLFVYCRGMRQTGPVDFSLIANVEWREIDEPRRSAVFPNTGPRGFYPGMELALFLCGIYWGSLVSLNSTRSVFRFDPEHS